MNDKLGINLKKILKHRGIIAAQLSRDTGISQSIINKITMGKNPNPRLSTVYEIAKCLNISIEQLLSDHPTENIKQAIKIPLYQWKDISYKKKGVKHEYLWSVDNKVHAECFALVQKDSSMEPLISAKSTLIIDPTVKAKDHDYIILIKNKTALIRMLIDDGIDKYWKIINPEFNSSLTPLENSDKIAGVVISVQLNVYNE